MIDTTYAPVSPRKMDDDEVKMRDKIRQGLAGVCQESLTLFANRDIRSAGIRLAETLETTLPAMIPYFPPDPQQKMPFRIQQMTDQESDAGVKDRLVRITEALKNRKPGS